MTIVKNLVPSPLFIIAAALVIILFIAYMIFVARLNKGGKAKVNKHRDL